MRRVQPFTIGTRLSVPLAESSRLPEADGGQEDGSAAPRSIRKIHICGSSGPPSRAEERGLGLGDASREAERRISEKLRDLKDGCNSCWAPLQNWEEVSQTLRRDLKDFENTLLQLDQMGEQLVSEENHNSDLEKKHLGQLRDHWHAPQQMAAKKAVASGGAGTNRKTNKMEVWIKQKEEQRVLAEACRENTENIQLTRKILDLEQVSAVQKDEKNYLTQHEETDHLASTLEKYRGSQNKNVSARKEHISEMWVEVQSRLKDYHENLQLALEVSSFYQLADNIINAIVNKSKSVSLAKDREGSGDNEIRDIVSRLMMLDVIVSRLSSFHPTLAARLMHKQEEVESCWALFQTVFRNEIPDRPSKGPVFTTEDTGLPNMSDEPLDGMEKEALGTLGKEAQDEGNPIKGHGSVIDPGDTWQSADSQGTGQLSHSSATSTGNADGNMGDVMRKSQTEREREEQTTGPKFSLPGGNLQGDIHMEKFTAFANKEGEHVVGAQLPEGTQVEELCAQLELLWEEVKEKHQKDLLGYQDLEIVNQKVIKALKTVSQLRAHLQNLGPTSLTGDSVGGSKQEKCPLEEEVLSCGLAIVALGDEMNKLQNEGHAYTRQLWRRLRTVAEKYQRMLKPRNCDHDLSDLWMALEESQGFPDDSLDGQEQSLLVQINQTMSQSAMLSMDILDAERDMSIDHEPDCDRLRELQEQQAKLEMDYGVIREELVNSGMLAAAQERDQVLGGESEASLQAWEELRGSMAENRGRLQQLWQLQDFFGKYQAMISWTEFTQACIFSGVSADHGEAGSELDMEQKFKEFEDLAAAGQKLIDEDHHLMELIKERTQELRNMMDWVWVHWRQKKQNPVTMPEEIISLTSQLKPVKSQHPSEMPISSHSPGTCRVLLGASSHDEGLNKLWVEPELKASPERSPLQPEMSRSPTLVLSEPTPPSLGGTVNLVLSFGESGGSQLQVDDTLKEEEASEPKHRVSAYLLVKEKQASDLLLGNDPLTHVDSEAQLSICPSTSTSSQEVHIMPCQDIPQCVSNSTSKTLKGKSEKRKTRAHRHTVQSMMGVEPENLDLVPCWSLYSTHTWPLEAKKKKTPKARPANTGHLACINNPLAKVIDTKHRGDCFGWTGKSPTEYDKNQWKYLPLGSVLSFDLPKDLSLVPSIPDIITINPLEPKNNNILRNNVGQNLKSGGHKGLSRLKTGRSPPDHNADKPTSKKTAKLKQAHCKKDLCQSPELQNSDVNLASPVSPCDPLSKEHATQDHVCGSLGGLKISDHASDISSQCEAAKRVTSQTTYVHDKEKQCNISTFGQTSNSFIVNHVCPSVHTKIQDLNGHVYHAPALWLRNQEGSSATTLTASLPTAMELRTSVREEDSADFGSPVGQHVKLGAGKALDGAVCVAAVEAVGSLERDNPPTCNKDDLKCESADAVEPDIIHPDHRQFEEDEAELKDIWSQISGCKSCHEDTWQTLHGKMALDPKVQSRKPIPQEQEKLCKKPVTVSAHNLLVAEFKLPTSVQNLQGYNQEENSGKKTSPILNKDSPLKEQHKPLIALTNQRAFSAGEFPKTDCRGAQGMEEEAGEKVNGSHSRNGKMADVRPTEGVLLMRRKAEQTGEATWTPFHALLLNETLCFYRHRKDILQSSAPELTVDLADAECFAVPGCTGKAHCFCLRMSSGCEYVLSSPSPSLMMKIQDDTEEGLKQTGHLPLPAVMDQSPCTETAPNVGSSSHRTRHRLSPAETTSSSARHNGTSHASSTACDGPVKPQQDCGNLKAKATFSDAADCDQCNSVPRPPLPHPSSNAGCPSGLCPSHPCSSAAYQEATPAAPICGSSVGGSSYSVTLHIGDQLPDAVGQGAQARCLIGWQRGSTRDACLERSRSLPGQWDETVK